MPTPAVRLTEPIRDRIRRRKYRHLIQATMTVSEEVHRRVADLVELQPTKNKELQERWGLDSGSAVHAYLESELEEYYYRDDNSMIRATPAAERLVGEQGGPIEITAFQESVLSVLPDPDEDSMSVVATFHRLEEDGRDTGVDDVRSALRALVDRGLVEVVERAVPTYRLSAPRMDLAVTVKPDAATETGRTESEDLADDSPSETVDELVVDLFEDGSP